MHLHMDKHVSIKVILDNILDHPLLKDVTLERAINYTINFIRIVGCPDLFKEKSATVNIKDYRGVLPCDYNSIIQIRTKVGDGHNVVLKHTTNTFHISNDKESLPTFEYKIQGGVILTSFKDGEVEVVYRAIETDEEGYPLIVDNSSFIRALELYIKKQCFTVLFDLGKITPAVYNNVLQEYSWAVGQAQSDLIKPTIDQMIAITNMWNTLVPYPNRDITDGFKYNGI